MKRSYMSMDSDCSRISYPRTDLACESIGAKETDADGTSTSEYSICGIEISELRVNSGAGERATGRKTGRYITLHCRSIDTLEPDEEEAVTEALSQLIKNLCEYLCKKPVDRNTKVLIAGLGNRFITADAIGPRTADKTAVTAHMSECDFFQSLDCSAVSAVHPGVMGQTGIEAAALIKGAAEYAKPDVVIAVDALCARSAKRLAATIQLSDTGIEPGSGIGNRRCAVNRETVGCPVIALGVPTIVDSATLVFDSLEAAGVDISSGLDEVINSQRSFFVSPRNSDVICDSISDILSSAINRAFSAEGL